MSLAHVITGFRHDSPDKEFRLADIDPGEQPFSSGDEQRDKARVDVLAKRIADQQERLFAGKRHRIWVVLQGLDASGKDGAIRAVFGRASPLGVRAISWREPSALEQAHDPLWRMHAHLPGDGELVIYNRSHYEEAIEPAVNGTLKGKALKARCRQINDFERMLTETGTLVLKFLLLISRDEQRARFQDRQDDPSKRWKLDPDDERKAGKWAAYTKAYQSVVRRTGTPWAPWYLVPSNAKPHRNLMIASVVEHELAALKLRFPRGPSVAST